MTLWDIRNPLCRFVFLRIELRYLDNYFSPFFGGNW